MADRTVGELTAATSLADTDLLYVERPGSPGSDLSATVALVKKQVGPVVLTAVGLTLDPALHNNCILICTAAVTIVVPSAATLGVFRCTVWADGFAVTLDGPGASNIAMSSGDRAIIETGNGKVWALKAAATLIS